MVSGIWTVVDTVWWSTVADTVASPGVGEVTVVEALPLRVPAEVGSAVPKVVEKATGVPSGMWPREDVSAPAELWVRSAVTTTPAAADWKAKGWPGGMPRVSQGSASTVPAAVTTTLSQPGWPGPALQPNQLFSALMTSGRGLRLRMPAEELSTMRLKCALTPPAVAGRLRPMKALV